LQPPTPEFLAAAHPEDAEPLLPWRKLAVAASAVLVAAAMLTAAGRAPAGPNRPDRPRRALTTVSATRTR
jgi:hypothetical protein